MTSRVIGLSLMLLFMLPARGQKLQEQRTGTRATTARAAPRLKAIARRDPFKLPSPRVARPIQGSAAPPPGRRGLVVAELKLKGIVREEATQAMIAVVTNGTNLAYFLRESDALYDGAVTRITPDSIEFRQNYLDEEGLVRSRQVIKKLTPAGGEGP
jgi:hypothetical protein